MRKLMIILSVAFLAATTSYAQNPHFIGSPCFGDQGLSLQACMSIAGLGSQDVTITVYANGTITRICYNPGGNPAPGQNRFPTTTLAAQTIPSNQVRNGRVDVCLTTAAPTAPACRHSNWTPVITDLTFNSARIVVEQGGQVVIDQTFHMLTACP